MEAFESFVALTLEHEGFVVSEAVKFGVTRKTAKASHDETQTHGFEVDLLGARAGKLVLCTVKSFFGSRGVVADDVLGANPGTRGARLYALLNDPAVRDQVIKGASGRYGYSVEQLELRLYVGKFAGGARGSHEQRIRGWCGSQIVGGGPIRVFALNEVATVARQVASSKTYRDNPALVAIKVLDTAGMLVPLTPESQPSRRLEDAE